MKSCFKGELFYIDMQFLQQSFLQWQLQSQGIPPYFQVFGWRFGGRWVSCYNMPFVLKQSQSNFLGPYTGSICCLRNLQLQKGCDFSLIFFNPSRQDTRRSEKIYLNFYFYTSLWGLKRFYEGLKGLHKTFWGTTKKWENKNLTYFNTIF